MRHVLLAAVIALLVVLGLSRIAGADPILFTDRATFEETVAPDHRIESFPMTCSFFLDCTYTDNVLRFGVGEWVWRGSPKAEGGSDVLLSLGLSGIGSVFGSSVPLSALGFDVLASTAGAQLWVQGVPFLLNGPGFVGLHFEEPITVLSWFMPQVTGGQVNSGRVQIDNLAVRTVPEPSTVLLFVIAVGLLTMRAQSHRIARRCPSRLDSQSRCGGRPSN